MPNEPDNIEDKLKAIVANPQTRSALASIIASPRPQGWGRKSTAPYFKKEYAERFRPHIDQQIESKQELVYRYDVWCKTLNISERTLYNQLHQGILFLIEKLDPTGKYAKWWNEVVVDTKTNKVGIVLSLKKTDINNTLPKPEFVEPRDMMEVWKRELYDWMESDSEEPFVKENICLNEEEIRELKNKFESLEGVMADIRSSKVSVIKL